jgi:hypothetical protein
MTVDELIEEVTYESIRHPNVFQYHLYIQDFVVKDKGFEQLTKLDEKDIEFDHKEKRIILN